jgi:hypothetical protein
LVSEAMIRVGRVLAALELAETQMTQLAEITTLTSAQANSVLMELLRSELADLLQRYDSGVLFAETDACRIDEAREALKAGARTRDFRALAPRLRDAACVAGVDLPDDLPTSLALQGATLKRQLLDIETAAGARRPAAPRPRCRRTVLGQASGPVRRTHDPARGRDHRDLSPVSLQRHEGEH